MHNDSAAILDDLLSRWHHWMKGKPLNGVDRLDDPTFRDTPTRSGWDSSSDIIDSHLHSHTMACLDFQVSGDSKGQGGLNEPYRSAIYCIARNCYTGRKVWLNPRLPQDPHALGVVLMDARLMLTQRLISAGVM